jgi:hypothetical protein
VRTLIGCVADRASACTEKYQCTWSALIALAGLEACTDKFKELRDSNIQVDTMMENNAQAMAQMSRVEGGAGPHTKKNTTGKYSKGRQKQHMSWIWTVGRALDQNENAALHCRE